MRFGHTSFTDHDEMIAGFTDTVCRRFLADKKIQSFEDVFDRYWNEMGIGNQNAVKRKLGLNLKQIRLKVVDGVRKKIQDEIDAKVFLQKILGNSASKEED